MKTTILHFITIIALAMTLNSCQNEEVAPLHPSNQKATLGEWGPTPLPSSIPPDEVIRTNYAGATKWRVTYEDHSGDGSYTGISYACARWHNTQRALSTTTGSFYSKPDLKNSQNIKTVDLILDTSHNLRSPNALNNEFSRLTMYKNCRWMSLDQLENMYIHTPHRLQDAYESRPFASYGALLETGNIILFKTDEDQPRYGAVHVIEQLDSGPCSTSGDFRLVMEIIVQKENNTNNKIH
ncbi:MAG: hypothetical protein AAF632_26165 [Bacteroidota bacterium]